MKSILMSLVVLASSQAMALTFAEFDGKYQATPVALPYVMDTFEIRADGSITLREELTAAGKAYVASYGVDPATIPAVDCQGTAIIYGNFIQSVVSCNNGETFNQSIDLTGVDFTQASFEAYVVTTANEASGIWRFDRLEGFEETP